MSWLPAAPLIVITLLTLGAVLTGCKGSTFAPPTDSSSLPSSASAARDEESFAPSFSVSTGAGSRFISSDHSGEIVVLYFSFPG